MYRGEDCVTHLLNALLEEEKNIFSQEIKPMDMSSSDQEAFHAATNCHICQKPLKGDKVKNRAYD